MGLSTLWGTRTVRTKRTEREKVKARGTWSGGRRSICTPVRAVLEDRDDKPAGPGRPRIRGGVRASRTQSLTQVVTTTRKHLRGSGVFSGSFPWRYPAYARPDDSHNYPAVYSLNFLCPPSSRRTARRPRPEINNSTSSLSGPPGYSILRVIDQSSERHLRRLEQIRAAAWDQKNLYIYMDSPRLSRSVQNPDIQLSLRRCHNCMSNTCWIHTYHTVPVAFISGTVALGLEIVLCPLTYLFHIIRSILSAELARRCPSFRQTCIDHGC